jgi:glycosyltransferase involved in cell wall biosynthesis
MRGFRRRYTLLHSMPCSSSGSAPPTAGLDETQHAGRSGDIVTIRDQTIVCVSSLDWDQHWTSKQQLMRLLSDENDVFYVEPARTALHKITRYGHARYDQSRGARLRVRRPFLPLPGNNHSALVRRFNSRFLARGLPRECDLLWFYTPRGVELIGRLRPRRVVYHCVDFHADVPGEHAGAVLEQERELLTRADAVFATSPALVEHCLAHGAKRATFTPHGVDYEQFSRPQPAPLDWPFPDRPVVLLSGTFDGRLDTELLDGVTAACPDLGFVLIGEVTGGARLGSLTTRDNVAIMGVRRIDEMSAYFHAASVGLIPYRIDRWTSGIFPLKFHEYLAAGLPVVTTPLPSLASQHHAWLVEGSAAAIAAIRATLASETSEHRKVRQEYARSRTWAAVLEDMSAELICG